MCESHLNTPGPSRERRASIAVSEGVDPEQATSRRAARRGVVVNGRPSISSSRSEERGRRDGVHMRRWASVVMLAGLGASGVVRQAPVMHAPRAAHSATALSDGRVLIAGGFTRPGSAPGAELYEMDASRSSATRTMLEVRHSHTATRLSTGHVLIVGGYGEGGRTLASAELFNPRTNRFTPAGRLVSARADHIAVLLTTGQVLVAGGLGEGWTYLSTAELYEPTDRYVHRHGTDDRCEREPHRGASRRWARPRRRWTRGPAPQPDVACLGGVLRPATRTFGRVGDMVVRRHKHDAVLLRDGRVLITGGSDERDGEGAYVSTEFFDPGTGGFIAGPPMVHARYKHRGSTVRLPTGDVLVAGGAGNVEVYDASATPSRPYRATRACPVCSPPSRSWVAGWSSSPADTDAPRRHRPPRGPIGRDTCPACASWTPTIELRDDDGTAGVRPSRHASRRFVVSMHVPTCMTSRRATGVREECLTRRAQTWIPPRPT